MKPVENAAQQAQELEGIVPTVNLAAEEGRKDFYGRAKTQHLAPLWRVLHGLVTATPATRCVPAIWHYKDVRPYLMEACELIGARDSEEFRSRLLNEAGVAVLADIHFGSRVPNEGQHIRFSYAASRQAIEQGVARLADFIRDNSRVKGKVVP